MPDAVPQVARQAWGEEVAVAFASWMDEVIRERFAPGEAIRPLDRARNKAWGQRAPSFLRETLGEEGVSELMDWIYGRIEKRVSSHCSATNRKTIPGGRGSSGLHALDGEVAL